MRENLTLILNSWKTLSLRIIHKVKRHKLFVSLLVVIMINSIVWGLIIPVWQNPDELSHFAYTQWLVEQRSFPSWEENNEISQEAEHARKVLLYDEIPFRPEKKFLFSHYEMQKEKLDSYQAFRKQLATPSNSASGRPPLYYPCTTVPYLLFYNQDLPTRIHSIRFISTIFLLITCTYVYKTARMLRFSKYVQIAITAFVGFQPMVTMLSASINPDALMIALAAAQIFYILKLLFIQKKLQIKTVITIAAITMLAICTKQNSPILVANFFIFIPLFCIKRIQKHRYAKKSLIISGICSILIFLAQWHILFNNPATDYFTGTSRNPNLSFLDFLTTKNYILFYKNILFKMFWAYFGWLDTPIQESYYYFFVVVSVISIMGILYSIIFDKKRRLLIGFTAFQLILTAVFFVYLDYRSVKSIGGLVTQGRYLLISISSIAIFLGIGWESLQKKLTVQRYPVFTNVLTYLLILINFISLFLFIYPRYYET